MLVVVLDWKYKFDSFIVIVSKLNLVTNIC